MQEVDVKATGARLHMWLQSKSLAQFSASLPIKVENDQTADGTSDHRPGTRVVGLLPELDFF
jgi:hypothetical protein